MAYTMYAIRNVQRYRQDYQQNVQRYHQDQLYQAVENRDIPKILVELKHGANLKIATQHGETVLHKAVKRPCIEAYEQKRVIKVLDMLVKQYCLKVDVKCRAKKTALHIAARNGMDEVVDYLLRHGADLYARDSRGNRIAHYIVEGEFEKYYELTKAVPILPKKLRHFYRESVHFLNGMLSKKMILDCVNKNLDSPLHLAARRNLLHLLPIMIENTHDVASYDKQKKTALHLFVENKSLAGVLAIKTSCYEQPLIIDILEMLLIKGYSMNSIDVCGNTPLHLAVYHDEPQLFEIMLKKFKKINGRNYDGNTLLHLTIDNCIDSTLNQHKEESLRLVRILLAKGADINVPNNKDYKPLHLAVMRTHTTILEMLKDHGADLKVSYNGGNLLHLLSQESNPLINVSKVEDVISLLVSSGCDVNSRDKDGMTPLHLAVQSGRNAVIEELITYHANVDARELSVRRLTPLQMAVDRQLDNSIDTLVKLGADVNAKDSSGKTALHLAMKFKTSMVTKLLKLGAHVDVEDDEELLPLHYAIRNQNDIALAELLKYGADVNDIDTYRELVCLKDPGLMLFGVLEHWIKMKVAGLPVLSSYKTLISEDIFQDFYWDCLKEIEELKACKISNRMSIYDLLHMDWNFRCAYTVIKPFKELIESTELQTTFPKYHVLILACYYEAVARRPLLEPAKHAWCEFTKILLPDVCVYRILAYLTNRELRVMVEGLRDRSIRKPCNLVFNDTRCGF